MDVSNVTQPEVSDYTILFKLKGNKYCFLIEELSLIGTGETMESAYFNLAAKRDELIQEYDEAGLLSELPQPATRHTIGKDPLKYDLKLFLIKSAIIATLMVALGVVAALVL